MAFLGAESPGVGQSETCANRAALGGREGARPAGHTRAVALARQPRWRRLRRVSENDDRVNALKLIPLLAGLPHSDLEQLAKKVAEAHHAPGSEIIKEGTSGSSVFLIVSGACEVRRNGNLIRQLGQGEFFGELSILDPAPRTATVRATETSVLLVLEGYDFRTALKSSRDMAQRLINALVERLRHMTDEFAPRARV